MSWTETLIDLVRGGRQGGAQTQSQQGAGGAQSGAGHKRRQQPGGFLGASPRGQRGTPQPLRTPGIARTFRRNQQSEVRLVERLPEHSTQDLVDALVGDGQPDTPPVSRVLVSEVSPTNTATLAEVANRLHQRLRTATPILVAIPDGRVSLDEVTEAWELTLSVRSGKEDKLGTLLQFLPELCGDYETLAIGSLASARVLTADVRGAHPNAQADRDAVEALLRERRGTPLDGLAAPDTSARRDEPAYRDPDRIAIAAPSHWIDLAANTLSEFAPVMGVLENQRPTIEVANVVFDTTPDGDGQRG